jgi:hypothetical protein
MYKKFGRHPVYQALSNPSGPTPVFSSPEWARLVAALRVAEDIEIGLERPPETGSVQWTDGSTAWALNLHLSILKWMRSRHKSTRTRPKAGALPGRRRKGHRQRRPRLEGQVEEQKSRYNPPPRPRRRPLGRTTSGRRKGKCTCGSFAKSKTPLKWSPNTCAL